jgi:hypothetical protein
MLQKQSLSTVTSFDYKLTNIVLRGRNTIKLVKRMYINEVIIRNKQLNYYSIVCF